MNILRLLIIFCSLFAYNLSAIPGPGNWTFTYANPNHDDVILVAQQGFFAKSHRGKGTVSVTLHDVKPAPFRAPTVIELVNFSRNFSGNQAVQFSINGVFQREITMLVFLPANVGLGSLIRGNNKKLSSHFK